MRKLKLQMQMSVDGFVSAGPNDEQKWVTWALEEIRSFVLELFDSSDTLLLGRKLAVDYIPYWQSVLKDPSEAMHDFSQRIVGARKIIFTKTLKEVDPAWENTELAKGNLADEVKKLKDQPGKDIIVYGGTSFVSALIREKLIDELTLFVNPVALGKGESIFSGLDDFQQFTLAETHVCKSGIIVLKYIPK